MRKNIFNEVVANRIFTIFASIVYLSRILTIQNEELYRCIEELGEWNEYDTKIVLYFS